jgi:hypothetical protein
MAAIYFSETLVSTYKSTRRYYARHKHRYLHCRENLKSHAGKQNICTNSFSVRHLSLRPYIEFYSNVRDFE